MEPVRAPKTAELIAQRLRRMIVRHELAADEALPTEAALTQQFGVSRPGVREALRILESEGLITIQRGIYGGARVRPPAATVVARYAGFVLEYQNTPISDVYRMRDSLELTAIRLISAGGPDVDLAPLREAVEIERQALDEPDQLAESEGRFHHLLAQASGSNTLQLLSATVNHVVHSHFSSVYAGKREADVESFRKAHRAHARVIDLLAAKRTEAARTLWVKHLEAAATYVGADANDERVDVMHSPSRLR
jgi:DNA-binding FadR family transcriptional regulator